MTNTQTRSVQITEVDKEARTFVGVFAPYDETITYGGKKERYERGLFDGADLVDIYWNHGRADIGGDMPIGEVVEYVETDNGLGVRGTFYETARAEEAYSLSKAGKLNSLSSNFIPTEVRQDDDVTVWVKAHLQEVSLVRKPAYPSAKISEVRAEANNATNQTKEDVSEGTSNKNNMTEINYDDSEIRSEVDSLKRELAVVRENGTATPVNAVNFRSGGEFLKALETGDEKAKNEVRAYTGAVLADSHTSNDWKADLLKIVDKGRPVLNLFDKGPLGSTGNNVEYPMVSGTTGDVAVQAAEGDDLAYLEVAITTATAPVKTYGGYSEVSRQVIERSDVSYLDAVLKFQAASYAKATNAAVRAAIVAATPQTSGVASFALTAATGASFINLAVDGVQKIEDNGLGAQADFVMVSADVYAKLATLVDSSNRPLFNINGDGSNTVGNVNVRGIAGSLAGLPVVVDAGLAAKTLYVASSNAVMTWENAGAPLRLQDENIINLTKQFSLYGYLAVGVKNANGLVKATIS